MGGIATAAALILAGVLAWAAAAKARRLGDTVVTFRSLRLPAPRALGATVPAVEAATAAVLVVWPRTGGGVAIALLTVFTAVLLRARRLGVACGCFGVDRVEPVTLVEVARNAMLAVLALAALAAPTPEVPGVAAAIAVTAAVTTGAVVLALADVRRHTGRLLDNTLEAGP